MNIFVLLIIVVLLVLCVGGLPQMGYAPSHWGYGPSGLLGLIFVVLLILLLTGRL